MGTPQQVVWVLMVGSIRNSFGMGSIHASLAGAYGAARKYMDEFDPGFQDWRPQVSLIDGKVRQLAWEYGLEECWIEEMEVRP